MLSVGDIGGLISGAGSLFGAISQDKANKQNFQAQKEFQDKMIQRSDAGTVDPFGTTVSRPTPGGPLKTELFGPAKQAADIGAESTLNIEKAKQPAIQAGGELLKGVAGSLPPPRAPLTLADARGIVDADNQRIKQAILNPALQGVAALAQRTRSRMSNAPNLIRQFQERIVPQVNLGGEKEALGLYDTDWNRYLRAGTQGASALMQPPKYSPSIPGTETNASIAQAGAMLPKPPMASPTYTGAMMGQGIGNALMNMQANQDYNRSMAAQDKLIQALAGRTMGDQYSNQNMFGLLG